MIPRHPHVLQVRRLLGTYPVVGILGPRQVGKTTLAAQVAGAMPGEVHPFDLEDSRDLDRLADPMAALEPLRGLVVLDEVQHRPELFPTLRVLADRPRRPARFLVLGSASPRLLHQSSESLAGRIAYHELGGLDLDAFRDRIGETAPLTDLLVGIRSTEEPKVEPLSVFAAFPPVAANLVFGLGLPQVVEFFLRGGLRDVPDKTGIAFSRLRAAAGLMARARLGRLVLGPDAAENARILSMKIRS